MKALILKGNGYATSQPEDQRLTDMTPFVELADFPEPQELQGEQVKIKVSLASVNPSDEMFIQGLYGQPRQQGKPAGFEGVGTIVATGDGKLAKTMMGMRVAFAATPSGSGTWAEYAVTDAPACIPLIPQVRDEDGAAMIVNPLTALAMFDLVKSEAPKSFIISAGASQLCKLMIGVAKDEGYRPIAVVRRDEQIDLLKSMGAAHVLNENSATFDADLRAICKEEKPKVFLDAVSGDISDRIFGCMGRGARWVIYGKLGNEKLSIAKPGELIFMSKTIEGFWLTKWMGDVDLSKKLETIKQAQTRFASGEWKTDVTAVLSLDEVINRMPEELAKPNGKVFIKP